MASQPPVNPNINPNPHWTPPPRRRSMFGPIFLIGMGIILLLVSSGRLHGREVAILFADYWPVLLILWGVIKLVEYMNAKREGYPAPGIGGGGVVLLIFLILFGLAATGTRNATRNWDWNKVRDNMDISDDDFDTMFGGTKYDYTDNVEHAFPANGNLKVQVDRGAIHITPSTDDKLHIAIRKSLYSDNESEAKKISDAFTPNITLVDNVLTVDALPRGDWKNGRIDMDIMVPKKAAVDLMSLHGPISVTDRDGQVTANGSNGDVTVENVNGNVTVHMRNGSFSAKRVAGDVNLEGHGNNVNVEDTSGKLSVQGEYDEIQMNKIAKGVKFSSTRTDMEFGKLDGELSMSHGELRANTLAGPFRLSTRSKDVELEDVSGDVKIDDANGQIQVTPKDPVANLDITNKSGEVTLMLPQNGNFTVDASSVRGEIESEFDLNQAQNQGHEAHYTGNVGKGGPRVQVRNDHGTIHINKK